MIISPDREFGLGVDLSPDFEHINPVNNAKLGIVCGSQSDVPECVVHMLEMCEELELPYEAGVTSMHRTHGRALSYASLAHKRGLEVIIACAGGSAHLPGMVAAAGLQVPVLAVAPNKPENDLAAMYSTVRMPAGVPCAYLGSGKAGAINAVLFAAKLMTVQVVTKADEKLREKLLTYHQKLQDDVPYSLFGK